MEDFSRYNGPGTILGKAQERMLGILIEIDAICRRNNIPYWIDFGTLLGAVRHKGFIPWDDDMDISIMREDRKRFCDCMRKELPQGFKLFDNKSVKYFSRSGIIKIMDCKSSVVEKNNDADVVKKAGYGLWVDVFCMERGNTSFRRKINETHGRFIRRMQGTVNDGSLNKIISYLLYPFTSAEIAMYRLLQKMKRTDLYIYDIKALVANALFSQRRYQQIFPLKEIEFEGRSFLCPNDIEAFLTETYHNYMELPPEDKRVTHIEKIEITD